MEIVNTKVEIAESDMAVNASHLSVNVVRTENNKSQEVGMCVSSGGCSGVYEDEEFRKVTRDIVDEDKDRDPNFFTFLFSLLEY
ncbi:MAG TPA: hypothetical protein DEA43_02410 [Candidatus Moranbacteria bacterium]|nr:hypothetical protein [Candidatus Moranbacteria bacterium]HBT45718.1 hypothetical protein [Candidatus Moranbacteria bacterium]